MSYTLTLASIDDMDVLSSADVYNENKRCHLEGPRNHFDLAAARLKPAMKKHGLIDTPLLVQTKTGLWVLWRHAFYKHIEVLQVTGGTTLHDDKIIRLSEDEEKTVKIIMDRIIINPPSYLGRRLTDVMPTRSSQQP